MPIPNLSLLQTESKAQVRAKTEAGLLTLVVTRKNNQLSTLKNLWLTFIYPK